MKKILLADMTIDNVGGVERIINTLSNNLCDEYEVTVLSKYKTKEESFYKYDSKVKRIYMFSRINIWSNKKNYIYYVKRFYQKINEKFRLLFLKSEYRNLFLNNDIIIFGRVDSAIDFLPFLKKHKGTKKIVVRDAIHLDYHSKKIKKRMIKYFPKYVDFFIVSSDESVKKYQNFWKKENFIKYDKIYNPLGIVPCNNNYDMDMKKIVSIGRLDKQKGFENLILAFSEVYKKHNDWHLEIYGDGQEKKFLESVINEKKLSNVVHIKNAVADVTSIFKNASIFVMTSRYEGYANTLVEAMACGVPSISYNWLMGTEEIINDNINGIIVKLKNRDKYFKGYNNDEDYINLGKAINYLIENENVRKKIAKTSREILITRNLKCIIERWKDIIEK